MTYPMRRRSRMGSSDWMLLPSMPISPDVGSISRFTMRSNVVLPEPDVPTRTQVLPSGTPKLTRSTAGAGPPRNILLTS